PKRLMSVAPLGSASNSARLGRCTLTTSSASASGAETSVAPADSYALSGCVAATPAPRSTRTFTPVLMSALTPSGTRATRRSPAGFSLGPSTMVPRALFLPPIQPVGDVADDDVAPDIDRDDMGTVVHPDNLLFRAAEPRKRRLGGLRRDPVVAMRLNEKDR